jgi:hypothetical protein
LLEEERDSRTQVESNLRDAEIKLSDAEFKLSDVETKLRDAESKLADAQSNLAELETQCLIQSTEKARLVDRIDMLEEGNEKFFELKEKQVSDPLV